MLRALDIPARMVTGYLVDAKADAWVEVTGENAHAWAEYYSLGVGWVPLEATPPDGVASSLHGEESTAPEPQPDTNPADGEPSTHEAAENLKGQGGHLPGTIPKGPSLRHVSSPGHLAGPSPGLFWIGF